MFIKLLVLSLFLSGVSFTISITGIFKGFRELISKIHPKIEELIHCPYCLSHWILFILVFSMYSRFEIIKIFDVYFIDLMIYLFAVISFSGIIHWILLRAYDPVIKLEAMRKMEKMQNLDDEED